MVQGLPLYRRNGVGVRGEIRRSSDEGQTKLRYHCSLYFLAFLNWKRRWGQPGQAMKTLASTLENFPGYSQGTNPWTMLIADTLVVRK
jgi:hypothetical protein